MRLPLLRLLGCLLLSACLALPGAAQVLPAEETPTAAETPPAEALLAILTDEASLAALVAELERIAAGEPVAEEEPAAAPEAIGRRIALITQEAAQTAADRIEALGTALATAPDVFAGVGQQEIEVLVEALRNLLLVIAVSVAVFVLLRRVAIPIYRRMGVRARRQSVVRAALIALGAGLTDVGIVVLSWAVGYTVALSAFGDFGQIALRQTLYLNAFLAVEMIKLGVRLVLSPSSGALRPVPLADDVARYVSRCVTFALSVLGYGQLLVVPIVGETGSPAAERAVATLVSVFIILFLAYLAVRNRAAVAEWLLAQTRPAPTPVVSGTEEVAFERDDAVLFGAGAEETERRRRPLAPLAHAWYWGALLYLVVILLIVLTQPGAVVFRALAASVKIAVALVIGLVLSGALARAALRGVRLPPRIATRLPLLEQRLNMFVPRTLTVLRIVIVVAVALYVLDTLGAIGLGVWLASEVGLRVTGVIVTVALVLLAAFAIWLALTSWVDYRLSPDVGTAPTAREQTLFALLRNAATIALVILTLMFCLAEIGLDIGPLLASAGVLGLAIGFGAQKMVQDIITGIFIQFENAINVGDVIIAGGITGAVERLTVRSVSLRDLQGIYHIIPFSSVDTVSNYTRDFSYFVLDMGIAYREDVEEAKTALFDAYEELRRHPEQGVNLLGELEWFGLDAFGDSAVVLKVRIKTLPATQWGVGRAYNQIVKRIFDARDIEIPFPHQTIYFGQAKDGTAPALRVAEEHHADTPEAAPQRIARSRGGTG